MTVRDLVVVAAIVVVVAALLTAPQAGRLEALSVDVLFWLRDAAFGPRHAPSQSPTVVVALDEETYRQPPFRDLPKVFWTKRIARVLNAGI